MMDAYIRLQPQADESYKEYSERVAGEDGAVARVWRLHAASKESVDSRAQCVECFTDYPCATIRALDSEGA